MESSPSTKGVIIIQNCLHVAPYALADGVLNNIFQILNMMLWVGDLGVVPVGNFFTHRILYIYNKGMFCYWGRQNSLVAELINVNISKMDNVNEKIHPHTCIYYLYFVKQIDKKCNYHDFKF